jgi:hypothetical protein
MKTKERQDAQQSQVAALPWCPGGESARNGAGLLGWPEPGANPGGRPGRPYKRAYSGW